MARYGITIFLSAFLLFQIQPLIAKFILPWFGGGPAVWTTCMLFFQVVLLAGYGYAHLIASRLSPSAQRFIHLALLAASLAFLPIGPNPDRWKSALEDMPIERILALLGATLGLPYFLLSTTGPLLQESYRRETGQPPYRLYSLSNAGSLLALLSYPIAFEPNFALRAQVGGWSIGYGAFVLLCGWCALGFTKPPRSVGQEASSESGQPDPADRARPNWFDVLLWLSLATCGSVMLLATTNLLCQEISSVPFLWILPLSIYLLTFIICFDHERWYHRNTFLVLLIGASLAACFALMEGTKLDILYQFAIYTSALCVFCMVCHGELARAKPAPRFATLFYLMVAAGGALGGILVAIVAPLVLHDFWEYHIALVVTFLVAIVATNHRSSAAVQWPKARWLFVAGPSVALALTLGWVVGGYHATARAGRTNLETTRNFYGVLRVTLDNDPLDSNGPSRELINGRIRHGFQFEDPDKTRWPTSYYGHQSGVGLAIEYHPRRSGTDGMRIGVVGLGCGTLAAYGRPADSICFYEINPEVARVSDQYFTFRKDSEADVRVVIGDARIKMEQQIASGELQNFDVLAIDAFSSDAIPMHLLTLECVEIFRQHLKPDGLLCFHVSNRFLDLRGVVHGIARRLGYESVDIHSESDLDEGLDRATWVIVTNNLEFLETPEIEEAIRTSEEDNQDLPEPRPIVWSDDYASLWQVLKSP